MRKYDEEIVAKLNDKCREDPVYFVGVGAHDFQLSFGVDMQNSEVHIQNTTKVAFSLRGNIDTWEEGPTDIPVWLLIGQVPTRFELPSAFVLRMCLDTGDYIEFHTDEGPYETTTIDFGSRNGVKDLEVY